MPNFVFHAYHPRRQDKPTDELRLFWVIYVVYSAYLGHLSGVVFVTCQWSYLENVNMGEAADGKIMYSLIKTGEETTKESKMRIDAMHKLLQTRAAADAMKRN